MTGLQRIHNYFSTDPEEFARQVREFERNVEEAFRGVVVEVPVVVVGLSGSNLDDGDEASFEVIEQGSEFEVSENRITVLRPGWYQCNIVARYVLSDAGDDLFSALRIYREGRSDPPLTIAGRRNSTTLGSNVPNQGSGLIELTPDTPLRMQINVNAGLLSFSSTSVWKAQMSLHWVRPQ